MFGYKWDRDSIVAAMLMVLSVGMTICMVPTLFVSIVFAQEDSTSGQTAPDETPLPVYDTRDGPKTADQLHSELSDAGYPGPWDVQSMVAAFERAGATNQAAPAPGPAVAGVSPIPDSARQLLCFKYDPTSPERPITNVLAEVGGPSYGPGFDFLVKRMLPAMYVQVATPGGIAPENIHAGLVAFQRGATTPMGIATDRVQYLVDAERQGLASHPDLPAAWWMSYCTQPGFDPTQAVRLFLLDAQTKPEVISELCVSQWSGQMGTGLGGLTSKYLGQIAQRQAATGPALGGAFTRLCGLLTGTG